MTAVVLPAVARAALRPKASAAELVSRPGGVLHLYAGQRPGLADFTASGALRAGRGPVCGSRGRRWYLAEPTGAVLCGRCVAWARACLDLSVAPVTVDELLDVLDVTTRPAEVDAVQTAAISAGLVSARVRCPGRGLIPFHTLIRVARARLSQPGVGVVERNWLQRAERAQHPRAPRRFA